MPTHEGETTLGRYQREREVELARYAKMTPEEIERLVIDNLKIMHSGLIGVLIQVQADNSILSEDTCDLVAHAIAKEGRGLL